MRVARLLVLADLRSAADASNVTQAGATAVQLRSLPVKVKEEKHVRRGTYSDVATLTDGNPIDACEKLEEKVYLRRNS
jgi:hypothetical protein